MLQALTGFVVIGAVVAAGWLLARFGVVGERANVTLNRVAFFAASPALLFTVLARADLSVVFSGFLLVQVTSAVLVMLLFLVASRTLFRLPAADAAVGVFSAGYINANNIGLPVATYVIGDSQYVAPIILVQLLVLAPVLLTVLDASTVGRVSVGRILSGPVRNPIILGSLLGVIVALFGWTPPPIVLEPLKLLGGAAIPLMLLAFGISLRGQRPLAVAAPRRAILTASALKAVGMPLAAYAIAALVLRLPAELVAAATITAALPTAQNMTNYSVRYDRGVILARDTVLVTTVAAIPVILLATLLLRP